MSKKNIILKAEGVSKQYRLGLVGTGTLSHDLNRWWHKIRGKEDPYLKIGDSNDRSKVSTSDYVWALKDINFEVQRGEVLGIIGKNGAGKSTLLKILSKVTTPTTGEIKTKGRIASLLEVGTGFHPEMTGRENIYLNGAILGMTKAEIKSKEAEIIDFSGCAGYIDTPVKRYSSGMRVRLAFAVAAHLEPDILVVDEVLAVGDAEFQKKAIGKMQDISKGNGRTVLFVSHNMAAVKNLCTRAILLEHGKIVKNDKVNVVLDYYLSKNNIVSTFENLKKSKREKGTKQIMTSVEILNTQEVLTNEDLKVRIHFNSTYEGAISLGYLIKDEKDNNMCAANMKQYDVKFKKTKNNYIDFTIKQIALVPGKYSMSLYFGDGKYDLDVVLDAIFFQVYWCNDLKIKLPLKKWGNVFNVTNWSY